MIISAGVDLPCPLRAGGGESQYKQNGLCWKGHAQQRGVEMSNEITAWVVSVTFHEQALTEINEVSNHFTRAGFVLTLNDEEGTPHELGTNTFGLLSGQTAEEVKALSAGLAEAALGRPAEIAVATFAEWLKAQ